MFYQAPFETAIAHNIDPEELGSVESRQVAAGIRDRRQNLVDMLQEQIETLNPAMPLYDARSMAQSLAEACLKAVNIEEFLHLIEGLYEDLADVRDENDDLTREKKELLEQIDSMESIAEAQNSDTYLKLYEKSQEDLALAQDRLERTEASLELVRHREGQLLEKVDLLNKEIEELKQKAPEGPDTGRLRAILQQALQELEEGPQEPVRAPQTAVKVQEPAPATKTPQKPAKAPKKAPRAVLPKGRINTVGNLRNIVQASVVWALRQHLGRTYLVLISGDGHQAAVSLVDEELQTFRRLLSDDKFRNYRSTLEALEGFKGQTRLQSLDEGFLQAIEPLKDEDIPKIHVFDRPGEHRPLFVGTRDSLRALNHIAHETRQKNMVIVGHDGQREYLLNGYYGWTKKLPDGDPRRDLDEGLGLKVVTPELYLDQFQALQKIGLLGGSSPRLNKEAQDNLKPGDYQLCDITLMQHLDRADIQNILAGRLIDEEGRTVRHWLVMVDGQESSVKRFIKDDIPRVMNLECDMALQDSHLSSALRNLFNRERNKLKAQDYAEARVELLDSGLHDEENPVIVSMAYLDHLTENLLQTPEDFQCLLSTKDWFNEETQTEEKVHDPLSPVIVTGPSTRIPDKKHPAADILDEYCLLMPRNR